MFFKLWLHALRERVQPVFVRGRAGEPGVRMQLLRTLHKLHPMAFSSYRAARGQAAMVEVPYRHMDELTHVLNSLAYRVASNEALKLSYLPQGSQTVSLDRFLTSVNGYYLHPDDAVRKFKHAAVYLCESLDTADELGYGVPEHNLRMLTPTLQTLLTLATRLVEISTEA